MTLLCQALGIALSPGLFLSAQAQLTRADTTNTTIIPTDVVPLAGAQERANFGENLQLRIMQRLPSRFYFSSSFELTERYETNPFQFPMKRELLKQLPNPVIYRQLDWFNQMRINDVIGLVGNDDAIFRLLPNVSAGWTVTPHTRLFTNYFMIRDQLSHNVRLNTIIHSLGAGIQQDFPIGSRGSLQMEFQGRELWQLHQQSVFDFLPGMTFSYILNPKTVLFVNSLVQMRGKAFFNAPTKEIDPFYTWGGLHQRNGWTFTASSTFVQNFREPFRGNSTTPVNNYVFICDFEIARRILKAYPGLQAFVRIEPIYNFHSHETPGLSGMDFRAFFGFRFAMAKPALTATLEQIRQQLEETETTVPKNSKPGTKPSAYEFPEPHELIAHNPQPIHGFLAKGGQEETAYNPDGEQPVMVAEGPSAVPVDGSEVASASGLSESSAPSESSDESTTTGDALQVAAEPAGGDESTSSGSVEVASSDPSTEESMNAELASAENAVGESAANEDSTSETGSDNTPVLASEAPTVLEMASNPAYNRANLMLASAAGPMVPRPVPVQSLSKSSAVPTPIAMLPSPVRNMLVPAPTVKPAPSSLQFPKLPSFKQGYRPAHALPGVSRIDSHHNGPLPPSVKPAALGHSPVLAPQAVTGLGVSGGYNPSLVNTEHKPSQSPEIAQVGKTVSSEVQPIISGGSAGLQAPTPKLPAMESNFLPATLASKSSKPAASKSSEVTASRAEPATRPLEPVMKVPLALGSINLAPGPELVRAQIKPSSLAKNSAAAVQVQSSSGAIGTKNSSIDGVQVARLPESVSMPVVSSTNMAPAQVAATSASPQLKLPTQSSAKPVSPLQVGKAPATKPAQPVSTAVSDLGDEIASPKIALLAFNSVVPAVIDDEIPGEELAPVSYDKPMIWVSSPTKAEQLSPEKDKAAYKALNKKLAKEDTNSSSMKLVPPLPQVRMDKRNPLKNTGVEINAPMVNVVR